MSNKTVQKKVHKKEQQKTQSPVTPYFYIFTGFLILFIPLFHLNFAMDITLMPRALALSIFLLAFTLIILGRKHFHKFNFSAMRAWIFPVVLGYLLITIASAFWAVNPRESFFDMVRTSLFLIVMLYAAVIFTSTPDWQKKILHLVIIAAAVAVVIGLVQYYNKVFLSNVKKLEDNRDVIYLVMGIMSHKNEFSTQLMLFLPFLGFAIYRLRKGWQVTAIITTLLVLMMILILKTRSVWVGLALGMILASIIIIIFPAKIRMPKILRIIAAVVIMTIISGYIYINSLPVKKDDYSFVGRIQNISNPDSEHNINRINVWKATMAMIGEKPYHGVGAGNWQMFIAPYCKGMFYAIKQLNWGRPHNDFLWVWAEKGIFALILYLSIFGLAMGYLIRVFFRSPHVNDKVLALLIMIAMTGYLTVSFFSFPYERINHTVYLALFMASAIVMNQRIKPPAPYSPNRTALMMTILAVTAFGTIYGYNSIQMERYMKKTISTENGAENIDNPEVAIQQYQKAIELAQQSMNPFRSLNPMSYPPEYYVAKSDYQIGKRLMASGQKEAALIRYNESLRGFERTLELFPGNVWTISRMGLIHNDLGTYYSEKGDTAKANEEFAKMIGSLEYMIELVPKLKQERKAMAGAYYKMGDYRKAVETLKNVPGYKKNKDIMRNIKGLEEMIAKQEKE